MEGVYPLTGDFKNHFKVKTSKTKPVGTEIHQQLSNIALTLPARVAAFPSIWQKKSWPFSTLHS